MRFFFLCLFAIVALACAVPQDQAKIKHFCGICKDIVEEGEKLGGHEVEGWIDKEIDVLCLDTDVLAPLCMKALHAVVKDLVNHILHKVSPTVACEDVHLC